MGDPLADFLLAGGCVIYARQSVTSGDDLSSCQVQFELCESYVRSQRSVGWLVLPERFDTTQVFRRNDRPPFRDCWLW